MKVLQTRVDTCLVSMRNQQKHNYDPKVCSPPPFKPFQIVYIDNSSRHFSRHCQKFDLDQIQQVNTQESVTVCLH